MSETGTCPVFDDTWMLPVVGRGKRGSGEVDLDPEVLYGRFESASGTTIPRRMGREPTATHA